MQREKIYYKSKSFVGLIIGFVLAAVMLLPTLAEADDSFTVEYKSENISVHGNTAVPYATVIIFVVPSDTELDSITENSANEKKFIAAAVNANETGDYSFSGVMPSWCVSGEYAVYAIYNGDKKNKNFFHINSERAMIAIFGNEENVGINGCNSYQEVKELLDSGYSTDLGIVEVNDDVAKMIFAGRPETGYTLDGFTSEYNSIKTIISISEGDILVITSADGLLRKYFTVTKNSELVFTKPVIDATGKISASCSVKYFSCDPDEQKKAVLVLAVYDGNKLIEVVSDAKENISATGSYQFSANSNEEAKSGISAKAFMWDTFKTLKPYDVEIGEYSFNEE